MVTGVTTVPDDRAAMAFLGAVLTVMALTVAAVLVIRVHRALRLAEQELEDARRREASAHRSATVAHQQKREAQRVLAILSEPLKDWDLADFPAWAIHPDRSKGLEQAWPLEARERAHIWDVVQAYLVVRSDAANARMSVTSGDMMRGRGWDDQPTQRTRPEPVRRNLP